MNDEERAAFRAFVREHHPDRGGDPEAFAAGLARFGTNYPSRTPAATPADAPRTGGPVDMAALPFPVRVGVALIRTWHRSRSPRVDPPADHP